MNAYIVLGLLVSVYADGDAFHNGLGKVKAKYRPQRNYGMGLRLNLRSVNPGTAGQQDVDEQLDAEQRRSRRALARQVALILTIMVFAAIILPILVNYGLVEIV
jgi:hypothetical protein